MARSDVDTDQLLHELRDYRRRLLADIRRGGTVDGDLLEHWLAEFDELDCALREGADLPQDWDIERDDDEGDALGADEESE